LWYVILKIDIVVGGISLSVLIKKRMYNDL